VARARVLVHHAHLLSLGLQTLGGWIR
jgi:hypothetical protein